MMNKSGTDIEIRRLTTPWAAAIAGILFGLLFAASLVLMRGSIPSNITTDTSWVSTGSFRISFALDLMPFAGIAYLWFIGVVRDKLGEFEDKFFSTVFLWEQPAFPGDGLRFDGHRRWDPVYLPQGRWGDTGLFGDLLWPCADAAYQQRVCPGHGGRYDDFAGHDLVTDRIDAPLAGCGHLLAGPRPAGGGQLQPMDHPRLSRVGIVDQSVHPVDVEQAAIWTAARSQINQRFILVR
jgi:hypothetical protein